MSNEEIYMKGRPENLNTVQPLRGKLPVKERISRKGQLKNIINKNMAYSKMFILVQLLMLEHFRKYEEKGPK